MNYLGNPSLAPEVQTRISATFQQTLDLVTQGKDQEAQVGCEFILRMDPAFTPARTLIDRLKSPRRPVPIADLRHSDAAGQQEIDTMDELDGTEPFDDLGALEDLSDFENLDDFGSLETDEPVLAPPAAAPVPAAPGRAAAPASAPGAAAGGLAAVIQDLLARRNFEQVLQIAASQKAAVESDPRVQQMVERARARLESDAYVKAFLASARQARDAGRQQEMEGHLAKARSLDPDHPEVLAFASTAAPSAPPAGDDDLLALQRRSLSLDSPSDDVDPEETNDFTAADFGVPSPELGGDLELDSLTFDADLPADDLELAAGDLAFDDLAPTAASAAAPAAPAAAAGENDRIQQLLQEGQEIYGRGEYQAAIDVWSRIFLIDIDNADASRRIEEARGKKAELERQAEEVFHGGVNQIERGALEDAKESLRRVLELQPSHSLAREYLEQLEAGQVPAVNAVPEMDTTLDDGLDASSLDVTRRDTGASLEAAVQRDRVVIVKKTDKRLIAVGALVAVVVIGGVAFLSSKWDDLFPNSAEAPPPAVQQRPDSIERATKMHEGGATANAINVLERIQPSDPSYEDAQALIAQWRALVETSASEQVAAGPSEEQVKRFNQLLDAAREAFAERQYIRARRYFERASKLAPLEAADLELRRQANAALEPLEKEIEQFNAGEYTEVIPVLWRKRDAEPENRDVEHLLIDAYYNLALTDLQRGDPQSAAKKLQDALEVRPDSRDIERLQLFAQTYVDRQQDLLYRIFVKYLPSR